MSFSVMPAPRLRTMRCNTGREQLALDLSGRPPCRHCCRTPVPSDTPRDPRREGLPQLDIAGALTITAAVTLLIYALVSADTAGWLSARTGLLLGTALALLLGFLMMESYAR